MAEPQPPPPSNIDLCSILSESRRILKAHTYHFLTLQLLFLLPVSLSLSLYPFINQLFSPTATTTTSSSFGFLQQNPSIKPLIIFTLLYTLIVSTFSNLATGSITHSVYHSYHGQPVNLSSSIKAAFTSFFPLLSTTLVRSFIMFGINLILGLVMFALLKATQVFLGFQVFYSSPYFIVLVLVYVLVLVFIGFYLGVNWIFADVVVVVESSWGAEPLKRSHNLVKGMKRVALKLLLFFGFVSSINTWRSMITPAESAADYKLKSWVFFLNIVVTCCLYMLIMLYSLAANTIFYTYAKAQHGQIAEEFAGKYVSLPSDDDIGKVPLVASIV